MTSTLRTNEKNQNLRTSVLLGQGLVDEVMLLVYPVLLGGGKRFFSDNAGPRELALVSTKATPTGVLMNTYRHVGSAKQW